MDLLSSAEYLNQLIVDSLTDNNKAETSEEGTNNVDPKLVKENLNKEKDQVNISVSSSNASKDSGESSSLDVMIHLRDGKGRICSVDCLKKSVPLTDTGKKEFHQKTPVLLEVIPSLVYADDETENVPLFQIGRQIKKTKKKEDENREREQILKPMRPVPITYVSGQSSRPFSFRIDEVSNHHNRRGFKLKINPVGDIAPFVASGIMWETMYVLSKPRSNRLSAKRKIDYS